jgi:GntR family transcriptional repressor for pyruvate dehydrogenase complex
VARSSVVEAVTDRLRREILGGRLGANTRLPAERELALSLGVNRLTLRAALGRLEATGLVVTKHGAGTMVTAWRERAGLDALALLMGSLSPWEPAWRELLLAMLELRRVLAAEAVAMAAERRSAAALAELARIAEEQADRTGDPLAFARGDVAFQRAVVRAAENVGFELVLNTFARFPDDHPALVRALYDRCEASLAHYRSTIELVRAGNAGEARELVRQGLALLDDAWIARNEPRPPGKKGAKGAKGAMRPSEPRGRAPGKTAAKARVGAPADAKKARCRSKEKS